MPKPPTSQVGGFLNISGEGNLTLFAFKIPNALPNQVDDLSVSGSAFILGNVVQFVMEFRFHFDSQMFIVFVSHNPPQNLNLSIF